MAELRVLSCSVVGLGKDIGALVAAVRASQPDVVAVVGAPQALRWRSKRAAIARQCGLVVGTAYRRGGLLLMASLRTDVSDTRFASSGAHAVVSATVVRAAACWRVAVVEAGAAGDLAALEPLVVAADAPLLVVTAGAVSAADPAEVVSVETVDVAAWPAGTAAATVAVLRA